jgi:hippurate hydrolase
LRPVLGDANVHQPRQELVGEDFSEYINAGVPGLLLWVGAVEQKKYDQWKAGGPKLPSLHSPFFAPDREPTLKTAILVETLAALELIK